MILATSRLAEYLKEPEAKEASLTAALEAAEAVVLAHIGTDTLLKQPRTETIELRLGTRLVPTEYGPITAVTSVKVDGEDVTATTGYYRWALRLRDETPDGATVEATYETGWAAADIPAPIETAILMTAASIYARPDAGLARVVTPNLTEVYRTRYLSDAARELLAEYVRPRL